MRIVHTPDMADAETSKTLAWVTSLTVPLEDFLEIQWDVLLRLFHVPVLVLAGAYMALSLGRAVGCRFASSEAERTVPWIALTVPLLYVGLFPARSVNHDFLWYVGLPFFVLAAVATLEGIGRLVERGPGGSRAATILLATASLAISGWGVRGGLALWEAQRSDRIERLLADERVRSLVSEPSNVIVTSFGHGRLLLFYTRAPILFVDGTPGQGAGLVAQLESIRERTLAGRAPGRSYFLFDELARLNPAAAELHDYLTDVVEPVPIDVPGAEPIRMELFDLTDWARGGAQGPSPPGGDAGG